MHGGDSGAIDSLRFLRADFPIQIIHQSLVFCDKLWASFSLPALDFEQSLDQMLKVFHIPLQWLVANKIGERRGQNCSKLLTSSLKCSLSRLRLQTPRVSSVSFAWLVVILPGDFLFLPEALHGVLQIRSKSGGNDSLKCTLRFIEAPLVVWEGGKAMDGETCDCCVSFPTPRPAAAGGDVDKMKR